MGQKEKIYFITSTALMTCVMCILGPMSLPVGPVPISLTNLVIYFTMYVLDTKRSLAAYLVYLLIGCAGLPVFSGYTGGLPKLAGPTGGYLVGFIPMLLVSGAVIEKHWKNPVICIITMEAATWICYVMGTWWLSKSTGMDFHAALAAGVIPFILVDFAKIMIAGNLGPVIRRSLEKAQVVSR